jgi:mannose-6-phosphate isomerase
MTSSDNVVRGGLTHKHISLDEFARLLDTRCAPPGVRSAPPCGEGCVTRYDLDIHEFEVHRIAGSSGAPQLLTSGARRPRILACVDGGLELRDGDHPAVALAAGEAALIPACVGSFEMAGRAEGILVAPGPAA